MYRFNPLILFSILIALFVSGCSLTPKEPQIREVVVTKVQTVVKVPPERLLGDCKIDAPPTPKDYINKDYRQKEAILVNFGAQQTLNLGECNRDKAALRQWRAEQLELVK